LRIIHACWHQPSINLIEAKLGSENHHSPVAPLRRNRDGPQGPRIRPCKIRRQEVQG
jgi:hypothetical protein